MNCSQAYLHLYYGVIVLQIPHDCIKIPNMNLIVHINEKYTIPMTDLIPNSYKSCLMLYKHLHMFRIDNNININR